MFVHIAPAMAILFRGNPCKSIVARQAGKSKKKGGNWKFFVEGKRGASTASRERDRARKTPCGCGGAAVFLEGKMAAGLPASVRAAATAL